VTIIVDHTSPSAADTVTRLRVHVPARTRLLERLAMRVALALLLWSTRPRASAADLHRRAQAEEQRVLREARWQRLTSLHHP